MARAGHQARPAVVRMRGFQVTRTLRASSGRPKSVARSWHQAVIPGSGSPAVGGPDFRGAFFGFRIHVGKRNSSWASGPAICWETSFGSVPVASAVTASGAGLGAVPAGRVPFPGLDRCGQRNGVDQDTDTWVGKDILAETGSGVRGWFHGSGNFRCPVFLLDELFMKRRVSRSDGDPDQPAERKEAEYEQRREELRIHLAFSRRLAPRRCRSLRWRSGQQPLSRGRPWE